MGLTVPCFEQIFYAAAKIMALDSYIVPHMPHKRNKIFILLRSALTKAELSKLRLSFSPAFPDYNSAADLIRFVKGV